MIFFSFLFLKKKIMGNGCHCQFVTPNKYEINLHHPRWVVTPKESPLNRTGMTPSKKKNSTGITWTSANAK